MTFKPGDKLKCILVDTYNNALYDYLNHNPNVFTFRDYFSEDTGEEQNALIHVEELDELFFAYRFELLPKKKKHEGLVFYGTDEHLSQAFENEDKLKQELNGYGSYNIRKDGTEINIYELRYVKTLKKTPVEKTITVQEWK